MREIGLMLLFAFVFTAAAMGMVLAFLWLAPDEVVRCG